MEVRYLVAADPTPPRPLALDKLLQDSIAAVISASVLNRSAIKTSCGARKSGERARAIPADSGANTCPSPGVLGPPPTEHLDTHDPRTVRPPSHWKLHEIEVRMRGRGSSTQSGRCGHGKEVPLQSIMALVHQQAATEKLAA